MKIVQHLGAWCAIAAATVALAQASLSSDKPTESEHRNGPHGLEGWTLSAPVAGAYDGEPIPFALVIAREGHVVRRIPGDPFVWQWIFLPDGRLVAYEAGPLHFSMSCVLFDLARGREVARVDCYHDLPSDSPDWVKALEAPQKAR